MTFKQIQLEAISHTSRTTQQKRTTLCTKAQETTTQTVTAADSRKMATYTYYYTAQE